MLVNLAPVMSSLINSLKETQNREEGCGGKDDFQNLPNSAANIFPLTF